MGSKARAGLSVPGEEEERHRRTRAEGAPGGIHDGKTQTPKQRAAVAELPHPGFLRGMREGAGHAGCVRSGSLPAQLRLLSQRLLAGRWPEGNWLPA